MGKRFWSLVLSSALIGGVFSSIPARAQEAPVVTVPAVVNIDDPKGDANFVNDQDNAYGTPLAGEGDVIGPADVGTATDIMRVWFSNTAADISLNIELEGNPANLAYDSYFRFNSNAGKGSVAADETRGCLQWVASINGVAGAYTGETEGTLLDKCNLGGAAIAGPLVVSGTPDKTFVVSITFPRAYSPLLADGELLTAPFGVSRIVYAAGPGYPTTAAVATVDNTKRGTDYAITSGGSGAAPEPVPTAGSGKEEGAPGTEKGKPKAKGCQKGKGKKKGCKAKPKPATSCPPYQPGEHGAEAETITVTDAATEEKPVEVKFDAGVGLGGPLIGGVPVPPDQMTHNYHNLVVDSGAAEAGLYLRLQFKDRRDYDLYLEYPSGQEATHSGDFNTGYGTPVFRCGAPETGCSAGSNFEQLNGIRTKDCQGWTVDSVAYLTEGGEVTLTAWLGEIKADPAVPEGGQQATALVTFWSLLGRK